MLTIDLGEQRLYKYVSSQIDSFFPDGKSFCADDDIYKAYLIALGRVENCFKHIILPGFSDEEGNSFLSHLHTDQYAMFLYYFMNTLWKTSNNNIACGKIMALNRALHGFFVSYKCALPDIFCIQHPVGTVLGNAYYSDYLVVLQNVTVNTGVREDGILAPKLGRGLYLGAGSSVLGIESIGNRCSVGINTVVYNQKMDDDYIAVNRDGIGTQIIKRKKEFCKAQLFFRDKI